MGTNLKDRNTTQVYSAPWYNRPLWGSQSFFAWFKSVLAGKQEIPESTQAIYRDSMNYPAVMRRTGFLKPHPLRVGTFDVSSAQVASSNPYVYGTMK